MLRPYQADAVEAGWGHIRRSLDWGVIVAATGAGKSHLIAALAEKTAEYTGNGVLCIQPRARLVRQNYSKFIQTGAKASIFSASVSKDLRHGVVFGTPQTILNGIDSVAESRKYSLIVIDEAHGFTPTTKRIISAITEKNPRARVIGLTATPYRLGMGFIYGTDPDGEEVDSVDPPFSRCVYEIGAKSLIEQGYLTPPVIGELGVSGYDVSRLRMVAGRFTPESVSKTYKKGRKTEAIVADLYGQTQNRKGVFLFCASIAHAEEVLNILPANESALITSRQGKKERERILDDYDAQRLKYLVSVDTLTEGVDCPHTDAIVFLRRTESVRLMQQMAGRGMRLSPGKDDFLILDYAGNIEAHCPDGDIFSPEIASRKAKKPIRISISCPSCGGQNNVALRPEVSDWDSQGYALDITGERIVLPGGALYPAHAGRKCPECGFRWAFKVCKACGAENDIAARACSGCGAEIIDPNKNLIVSSGRVGERYEVRDWQTVRGKSQNGHDTLVVDYYTNKGRIRVWYLPGAKYGPALLAWNMFRGSTDSGKVMPRRITALRDGNFYRVQWYD